MTDIGSISTVLLPDKLVLAFTPNLQSLTGAVEIGRQAVALKRESGGRAPLALFPLVSRIDEGEEKLRRKWLHEAAQQFTVLFAEVYGPPLVDFTKYFEAVHVPHSGYYAYGESIAVEEDSPAAFGSLAAGYARFLDCLRGERMLGWEERLREPLRAHGATVLAVGFHGPISLPPRFSTDPVIHVPRMPIDLWIRHEADPIQRDAWEKALAEIDSGVSRALATGNGDIYVFASVPYPAAVYLGRRLDDLARGRPLIIHQIGSSGTWFELPKAGDGPPVDAPRYYGSPEHVSGERGAEKILLALEGVRPIADSALVGLAQDLGNTVVYRLRPEHSPVLTPAMAPGAVQAVRSALIQLQTSHPRAVLHVVATAPVSLLVELGRAVPPTVYRSVVVHQYLPGTDAYLPVVDVVSRRVIMPEKRDHS